MPSRRELLVATGLAGLGAVGASRVRLGPIDPWTPPPDSWPLRRYDPANTAANPNASPPSDPSVSWTAAPLGVSRDSAVVADREMVYAAGNGVAALDRTDGTVHWQSDGAGGPIAVRDDTVFVAPGYDQSSGDGVLRAIRIDGVERWRQTSNPGQDALRVDSLVVADDTLFVGGRGTLRAYGAAAGRLRWSVAGGSQNYLLVGDGRLHASMGPVARYRRRSLLSVGLHSPGTVAWETAYFGQPAALAATDTRLVAGFDKSPTNGGPALVGIGPRDGAVRWSAFHADDGAGGAVFVGPLAAGGGDGTFGIIRESGDSRRYAVASCRLSDGTRLWRREVEQRVTDIARIAGTVVVATAGSDGETTEPSGTIRALRAGDGSEVWRIDLDDAVLSIAPVDETIFAATLGGQVIALR